MSRFVDSLGSYRQEFTTGAVTTIAAATSSAGHLFSMRFVHASHIMRLKSIEVEFVLTTAFTAAQEVGFDIVIGRSYSASPTGATQVTIGTNDAKKNVQFPSSAFSAGGDVRIANTGAMTAGTVTLDGGPIARGSVWCGAVGAILGPRLYDFTADNDGILLATNEGFIVRNSILMGTAGVGKWHFTVEWEEGTAA